MTDLSRPAHLAVEKPLPAKSVPARDAVPSGPAFLQQSARERSRCRARRAGAGTRELRSFQAGCEHRVDAQLPSGARDVRTVRPGVPWMRARCRRSCRALKRGLGTHHTVWGQLANRDPLGNRLVGLLVGRSRELRRHRIGPVVRIARAGDPRGCSASVDVARMAHSPDRLNPEGESSVFSDWGHAGRCHVRRTRPVPGSALWQR